MLRMWYELSKELPEGMPVDLSETRGTLVVRIAEGQCSPDVIDALNAVAKQTLAGGQWFQLWQGDIVSMNTPDEGRQRSTPPRSGVEGEKADGLHRGQVA